MTRELPHRERRSEPHALPPFARLTAREEEILLHIGRRARGREIASELGISEYTVRKHRASIIRKMGLTSAAQLISIAVAQRAETGARADEASAPLCPREKEILGLLVCGLTSKEIARRLAISPLTVNKHRQNLMRKRRVHSLAELIERTQPAPRDTESELYYERLTCYILSSAGEPLD